MNEIKKPTRNGALTDLRRTFLQQYTLLLQESKTEGITTERKDFLIVEMNKLLMEMASLQKVASRKWKHHREQRPQKQKRKAGRPRKEVDSHGEPLYNDSPKREDPTSKEKFLNEIKANDEQETESDSQ